MRGFLKWVALAALAGIVGMVAAEISAQQPAPEPTLDAWTRGAVGVAQDQVRARLRNPPSATFRHVEFYRSSQAGRGVVCGQVNATNGFGGFTGLKGFLVRVERGPNGGLRVWPAVMESDMPTLWSQSAAICREGHAPVG